MSWPWVLHLRDAVADRGDPYMIAWTLWWDYHQTFRDPLNLFHANVFYPYRYTLAFSEHDYGIALVFFPLFAAGLRPLTIHSIATFCGFAFSGYGAFRLARTLTRSNGVAWTAGVVFAFIPYRFHLLSHLHYLFAGWIPLLLESLVLYVRERSWRRASWLGVAFLMNALTCISWFILTLPPLALSVGFLLVRYPAVARERAFWLRAAVSLAAASLLLLPFMLPYYHVSKLYGFVRTAEEAALNSPRPVHWLIAEGRNRVWRGFGSRIPDGGSHRLFPGLLPLLLALAAWLLVEPSIEQTSDSDASKATRARQTLILALDLSAVVFLVLAMLGTGYEETKYELFGLRLLGIITPARALFLAALAVVVRCSLAYPRAFRRAGATSFVETVRDARRSDAFWLGSIWALTGFLCSLGMNFFLNRILFNYVPLFRGLRIPSRAAMICYVGLAILAGLGAARLAHLVARWHLLSRLLAHRPLYVRTLAVYALVLLTLLFELRAFPLRFERGEADPDAVTLRLKETPMRGGIVHIPAGDGDNNHRYMLRAADHQRPVVNGTSSFVSQLSWDIYALTRKGPVPARFLHLLEETPVSYLVIHNRHLPPERRVDFEVFLSLAVADGRLRFIRRFDGADDLYAVTKTEPEARSEAPMPFEHRLTDWATLLRENPVHLLGQFRDWSLLLQRLHKVSNGRAPRLEDFLPDVQAIGAGVVSGTEGQEARLEANVRELVEAWLKRPAFASVYQGMTGEQYVDRLFSNAGLAPDRAERDSLVEALRDGRETRAGVLLKIARDEKLARREDPRALVLLHYFGYLRRNPGDPPDRNLEGYEFWVREIEASGDTSRLTRAFMDSGEYRTLDARRAPESNEQR
ncbi:MAG TPA: hypothetical protein VGB73_03730 [Pyrinomonadaceae bacterium]